MGGGVLLTMLVVVLVVVTALRVGFGDMTPSSQGSRLFTTFFNLIGVLIDALAVSEVRPGYECGAGGAGG